MSLEAPTGVVTFPPEPNVASRLPGAPWTAALVISSRAATEVAVNTPVHADLSGDSPELWSPIRIWLEDHKNAQKSSLLGGVHVVQFPQRFTQIAAIPGEETFDFG